MHRILVIVGLILMWRHPLWGAPVIDTAPDSAEEILDSFDVPESERDTTEAEDLVKDEIGLREKREMVSDGSSYRPPGSGRAAWLPRLHLLASATVSRGRTETRLLAAADFPLGPGADRTAVSPLPLPSPPPAASPAPERRLAADPDVKCLTSARTRAVELAHAEPARARALIERARRANWLPELRLRVERRVGRKESLDIDTLAPEPSPLGLDTSNDVRYEARATWDLGRLIFSPEELSAAAQALRMGDARREIESAVNRLYFERRRMKADPNTHEPTMNADVRLAEIETELDTLSDGAFTRCVEDSRPKRWP